MSPARSGGHPGEQVGDRLGEGGLELDVVVGPALLLAQVAALAGVLVGQALLFGLHQRRLLHQDALALVTVPCPAESDHDGRQPARLLGPSGKSRVSRWQEHEVI